MHRARQNYSYLVSVHTYTKSRAPSLQQKHQTDCEITCQIHQSHTHTHTHTHTHIHCLSLSHFLRRNVLTSCGGKRTPQQMASQEHSLKIVLIAIDLFMEADSS